MKTLVNKLIIALTSVVLLIFSVCAVGCDGGEKSNSSPSSSVETSVLTLNETELSLNIGSSFTLTATIDEEKVDAIWMSSSDCVTVDASGTVTAEKEGEAIVTAMVGERVATCKITVDMGGTVPLLLLNCEDVLLLTVGDEFVIEPSLKIKGEIIEVTDVSYNLVGANISGQVVDTVNYSIKANTAGEAEITVTCRWNSVKIYQKISVKVNG